ncbi:Inner membrane protein YeeA [Psychrobacter pasteurii]|uniref:Inner membrane protein YeeA n=1 Tax=Psychrobacter pasteurii TaxID=1945520 RepID=A0A1R4EEP5_9GAMM|nr:FUSC family protein [Psychrobacter pasteurii]SJM36974.1 Inner membrane protein YeeA [Psychrobacter pasteurii]
MSKSLKNRLMAPLIEPYARYLHADLLHSIRLGGAVVASLIFSQVTQIPHSEWATITVFVILGLLQYQGAIYTKAKERVLGTLLGIVVGLGLLWINHQVQGYFGIAWLYYVLVGVISGVIGYYSIKQLGYIGLLTGITMCMVISSHNSIGPDGIARAFNVLIGTLFAVVATLILPLKSTLMWRFLLANNLEACANMYDGVEAYISDPSLDQRFAEADIEEGEAADKELNKHHPSSSEVANIDTQHVQLDLGATTVTTIDGVTNTASTTYVNKDMVEQFKEINKRLLRVRAHIAATAKESGMDTQDLDMIQRTHRNIIGTIDLLLSAAPKLAHSPIDEENRILVDHYHRELTQGMRHIAAVLRSPSDQVFRPITRIQVSDYPSVQTLPFEWQGYFWLTQTLQGQLQSLSDLLQQTQSQWYKGSGLRYQRQEQRRIHAHGGESDLDV